jgi:hypothetical protein
MILPGLKRSRPMRLVSFAFVAALASCGAPDGGDNLAEAGNAAVQPESGSGGPAAGPAVAAPAPAAALPAAFHGVYDRDRAACEAPASEYRLTVTPGELRFHESIATVRSVAVEGPRRLSVTADWQGEGERWSNVQRISLSPEGELVIQGEGDAVVRVRCP